MASLSNDPNGYRRILFHGPNGERKSIRLGKVDKKSAESILRHIEALVSTRTTGQPIRQETAVWLAGVGDKFKEKLARAGLIEFDAEAVSFKLGEFVDKYLSKRTDIKAASLIAIRQAAENLKAFFGKEKPMNLITAGDAEDFKRWLMTSARLQSKRKKASPGLSLPTVAKRLQGSVTIFNDAVKREIITTNPFVSVKQPKNTNPERQFYVKAEIIETIIDRAPTSEWKLLLAMSRYLGVRVPSEPFSMTWDCVDWEKSRLRVPSPKTANHGKSFRIVPILPQVREYLGRVFDEASKGAVYVFERLRERDSIKFAEKGFWMSVNLREPFRRMLVKAGIKPWPRLWHNLRASAQTDLANQFPIHVVCEWLGNTRIVAQNHYLQTTEEHFNIATGKAAQKTAQQLSEMIGNQKKTEVAKPVEIAEMPIISDICDLVYKSRLGDTGFEPVTSSV